MRSSRVAGVNTAQGDMYEDRDVYALTTDADTHAVDLRVAWVDAPDTDDGDLDVLLINAGTDDATPLRRIGGGNSGNSDGKELALIAVKPSTTYWLAVANQAAETVSTNYTLSVCGRP